MGVHQVKEEKIKKVTKEEFKRFGLGEINEERKDSHNGRGWGWDGLEKEEGVSTGYRRNS
jgi:hypothetical protein